jgi:uncharacterized repeat protein (TIGR01451 family)
VTATPLGAADPVTIEDSITHGFGPPLAGAGDFRKEGRQANDRYSVGQTAEFQLKNIQNTGNIPMDSIVITDAIPGDIALTQISTGRFNQDCSVDIYYQTDASILLDPSQWITWGGTFHSPNNIVLNAADLGLGGEIIQNVKWEITNPVDGLVPGFAESASPEIRGTVSMPGIGNTITNSASLVAAIGADTMSLMRMHGLMRKKIQRMV